MGSHGRAPGQEISRGRRSRAFARDTVTDNGSGGATRENPTTRRAPFGTTVDSSATHADGKSAEGTSPGLLAARELARANGGDVVLAPQDRDAGVRSAASGATITVTIRAESPLSLIH